MPIPKKKNNESDKEFVSRCMADPIMVSEYDEAQRYAICNNQIKLKSITRKGFESPQFDDSLSEKGQDILASTYASCRTQWVKDHPDDKENKANKESCSRIAWNAVKEAGLKKDNIEELKSVNLAGAMIMKPGTWEASTGTVKTTEKDIDEMITNFNNGVIEPYLNLDHDDSLTKKVADSLKVLALGYVDKLYKKGKDLYADFKQVPEKIAQLIKDGQLKQKSVEYFKKVSVGGKVYNNVLKAVSFFGASLPAVNGLGDYIEVLYKEKQNETITLKNYIGGKQVELEQKKYEELVKAQNDLEAVKEESLSKDEKIEKLTSDNKTLKTEKEKVDTENKELLKLKEDIEKDKADNLKKEAEDFVNDLVKAEKIMPKFKDSYINDYIEKSKDEKIFKLFKEDLESRGQVVNLEKIDYPKKDEVDDKTDDTEKLEKAIEAKMKANKGLSWAEAHKEVTGQEVN